MAESRDSLREQKLKKDNYYESLEEKNKHMKAQMDLTTLSDQPTQGGKNSNLASSFLKVNKKYTYKLKLKISCVDNDLPLKSVLRFKSIKWKIELSPKKNIDGESQVDGDGYIVVLISSKTVLTYQKINLRLNDQVVETKLLDGPHEVAFPPEACKKNDKK